jgi:hypothetical protein
MTERREQFLAGDRPDDVALYLSSSFVDDPAALAGHGEVLDDGVLVVVEGDAGRRVFETATGSEAMAFTREAMGTERHVDDDLTGGTCPEAGDGGDHEVLFVFAFAQERNEEAGDLYAEGGVMHAYARCECGASYSDRWVVGDD